MHNYRHKRGRRINYWISKINKGGTGLGTTPLRAWVHLGQNTDEINGRGQWNVIRPVHPYLGTGGVTKGTVLT